MNVIARLVIEIAYYDVVVQNVNHCITESPTSIFVVGRDEWIFKKYLDEIIKEVYIRDEVLYVYVCVCVCVHIYIYIYSN